VVLYEVTEASYNGKEIVDRRHTQRQGVEENIWPKRDEVTVE
jgi:hypothetical protein